MKNIEKQLAELQHQIEHLTGKVTQILENSPNNDGFLNRTLIRKQSRPSHQQGGDFKKQKGINRFRALQPNG